MLYEMRLLSVQKEKPESFWLLTLDVDGERVRFRYNEVSIGNRLSEYLTTVAEKNKAYPISVTFNKTEGSHGFTRKLGGKISNIELHAHVVRKLPVESNSPFHERGQIGEDKKPEPAFAPRLMARAFAAPPEETPVSEGIIVLEDVKVKDGDTISGVVYDTGKWIGLHVKKGERINIRYVGVQAPETEDHGEASGTTRNAGYMSRYKVTKEQAFKIGEEARDYMNNMLSGSGAVVVDVDRIENHEPRKDVYGRYVAVVYKTHANKSDVLKGDKIPSAINMNKSLLAKPSALYAPAPLGMPYEKFVNDEGYIRFDVMKWYKDLGLLKDMPDSGTVGEKLDDYFKESNKNNEEKSDLSEVKIKYDDVFDNSIDFLEPLDDRIEKMGDLQNQHRVRIGDVLLTVPPLGIQVNRTSHTERIKTLRTKGSILTKTGYASTSINLQLYFHDLEAINGTPWKTPEGMEYTMDGLRQLIAQFQKMPFLPIDNVYINTTLDIHDVALMNLSVETVPGFPHSIMANLTLAKFNSEAYMPQEVSLHDAINYPLMRWYYQRSLTKPANEAHTFLEPISGQLTNKISFSHADEAELEQRAEAIIALREMKPINVMRMEIDAKKSELGKVIADGKKASLLLEQYDKYQRHKKNGDIKDPDDLVEGHPVFQDMYNNRSARAVFDDTEFFAPHDSEVHDIMRGKLPVDPEEGSELPGYFRKKDTFKIFLWSIPNGEELKKHRNLWVKPKSEKEAVGYFYVTETSLGALKGIVERGRRAEQMAMTEIDRYNKLSDIVYVTESKLSMIDYTIPEKDMLVTSMQVMYENIFSSAQTRTGESPTMQFLGSQDVAVKLDLELTEDGVLKLRNLVDKIDEFARHYRVGISSGFLGIENQLLKLFGVRSVMIETLNVNTVPGFPGRFQGEMVLVAFNKTQRRQEELKGMSAVNGTDRDQLHSSTVDYKLQDAIIEYKMDQMEVYPDLELPTYKELNDVIEKTGAGIKEYKNKPGGIYVDPDFYASTKWTFRGEIKKQLEQRKEMKFSDSSGVHMSSSITSTDPMDVDKENMHVIEALEKKTPYVPYVFNWAEDNKGANSEKAAENATDSTGGAKGTGKPNAEVATWLKDKKNIDTPPPLDKWKTWGYGESEADFTKWRQNVVPKPVDFYKELYALIDARWVKNNNVYNDKNKATGGHTKLTYADPEDHLKLYTQYREGKKPTDNLIALMGQDKTNGMYYKEFMPTTRARIANYLKAFFHHQSKWNGFDSMSKPYVNGTFGGLGKVDIPNFATSVDDAQRFLWDWKYQLKVIVEDIYKFYVKARDSKEKEFEYRAWDYMLSAFYIGELKKDSIKEGAFPSIMSVWKSLYNEDKNRYRSPRQVVDPDIMKLVDGKSSHTVNVATSDKDALIKDLEDSKILEDVLGKEKAKALLSEIKKKSTSEVKKIYESYMKMHKDGKLKGYLDQVKIPTGGNTNMLIGKWATDLLALGWSKTFGGDGSLWDNWFGDGKSQETKNYEDQQKVEDIKDEEYNRLLFKQSPEEAFSQMAHNMLSYDMRGRLCRAFPTFQFFIIDEGRWMGSYRLWDNFYGFNAIQSIDVHRSRKQVADTAVISMTNVYSNLTARPTSEMYDSFAYSFWDNLVLDNPSDAILDSRSDLLNSMMLEVGARIHLRMGYGSSVRRLPTVFNGKITEMDTNDVITLVAQGDGLELTSVISGDPDDKTAKLFNAQEPRDIICKLLTSKGSWAKDVINVASENRFFRDNPLGVAHFGRPGDRTPDANFKFFNENYGEAAQNIYSANGLQTFSQWIYEDGTRIPMKWDGFILKFQGGDEDNILMPLYNQTIWDVATNISYCFPDYIAAVHPFETRSTLFFGKPYWNMAYRYDSTYAYNEKTKSWDRTLDTEYRRPYCQLHYIDDGMDIISNQIKASSDGMYTIVVGNYGGKPTPPVYADYDIDFSMQRTAVVDLPLISRTIPGWDMFTTEKQALYYSASTVRDYMKDMYKGRITIIGTPTLKPHDMIYMSDSVSDMNGNIGVEAVVHHFSHETGFISSVTPDAVVVIDDKAMLAHSNWWASVGMLAGATVMGLRAGNAATRKFANSATGRTLMTKGKAAGGWIVEKSMKNLVDTLPDTPETNELKKALDSYYKAKGKEGKNEAQAWERVKTAADNVSKKAQEWLKSGGVPGKDGKIMKGTKKLAARSLLTASKLPGAMKDMKSSSKFIKGVGTFASKGTPLGWIFSLTAGWLVESLFEKWRRSKTTNQAVLMMPLMHQGKEFTAGINGHKGMVVGDTKQGSMDNFLQGLGFDGSGDGFFAAVGGFMNFMADTDADDRKFTTSYQDLDNYGADKTQ
ncbi:virion structural protein_gp094 [Bacillus phage vB_BceM_WH1]|nr:virion structural protein_gp094 [Bacillus phage vB_BceM_WH1]